MAEHSKGPFRASTAGAANDGSIAILDGDGEPVLRVLLTAQVPKREAWQAEDPKRDANIQFVVDALNAFEVP